MKVDVVEVPEALAEAVGALAGAGNRARLVVTPGGEELDRHRHEVVGALARVQAIQSALQRGYKFDDAQAARYLELFGEAVALLKAEVEVLGRLYR